MPQYHTFKYGRIAKYGRYKLVTTDKGALGEHVPYRIRTISSAKETSEYVRMSKERITMPKQANKIRIRTNHGEWAYTDKVEVAGDIYKVRIKALSDQGKESEWIYGERANLNVL